MAASRRTMPVMPLRRTFLDEAIESAWRRVARNWRPMAGWTLLVWAAAAALLGPLTSAVVGRRLPGGREGVIGNEALLAWLLTPLGMIYLLLAGSLALIAAVVRYAGLFDMVTEDLDGRPVTVRRTAVRLAPQLPALFKLSLVTVGATLALLAPLLAGLAAVGALLLGEYDINYYLAARPPEWRYALIAAGLWGALWAFGAGYVVVRASLILPAYLDGHRPVRVAARRAWDRAAGSAGRFLRLMAFSVGIWLVIRVAVDSMVLAGATTLIEHLSSGISSLRALVLMTTLYLATSFAIDALIGFLGFSFTSTVLTKFYYEDTDLHREAPAAPSLDRLPARAAARIQPWVRPARALPLLALALAASALGSGLLLERLPEPRPVTVTAHRAGPPPAPENTLAALELSIAAGADYAEIDVQRTRDGVVVVLHDSDLMRMAGDPRRVSETDFAALAGVVQRPDDGSPPEERRIATLAEFLERARGRIGLNIELKFYGADPALAGEVVRIVREAGMEEHVVVMSLSLEAVRQLRRAAPELAVGYAAAVALGELSRLPVDFVAVARQRAAPRLLREARGRKVEVHVWTVNDAGEMAELIERGVDGLITDRPALALAVREELAALPPAARLLLRFRKLLAEQPNRER